MTAQRCDQCGRTRASKHFVSARSAQCRDCRSKYAGWSKLTVAERAQVLIKAGARSEKPSTQRVRFVRRSLNQKLGGIPATMTDRGTCPPSCSFYEAGCYASYGKVAHHWRETRRRGLTWAQFLQELWRLPVGQLWRHAVAGDLPGDGDAIDHRALGDLHGACVHTRGFTFTHKPLRTANERVHVRFVNVLGGLTINLSADDLKHADERADLDVGPVVVVLPHDAESQLTPKGRRVIICPAQRGKATCATCALCAKADRDVIVGFRAHGQTQKLIPEIVRARRAQVTT